MVILIGGAGHTGKTLMMKKLVEKTHFPALSLDHLKMGLIRAGITSLTPENDKELTDFIWPIAAEMVKTAIENRQDLILEGCYIPGDWAKSFDARYLKEIRAVYLVMTKEYVQNNFGKIQRCSNVVEHRMQEILSRDEIIRDNAFYQAEAERGKTPCVLIRDSYDPEDIFSKLTSLLGI